MFCVADIHIRFQGNKAAAGEWVSHLVVLWLHIYTIRPQKLVDKCCARVLTFCIAFPAQCNAFLQIRTTLLGQGRAGRSCAPKCTNLHTCLPSHFLAQKQQHFRWDSDSIVDCNTTSRSMLEYYYRKWERTIHEKVQTDIVLTCSVIACMMSHVSI